MNREQRLAALNAELAKRILILDGSMGAYLQGFGLTSEDFHGQRFADHRTPLKGDSDVLTTDLAGSVGSLTLAGGLSCTTSRRRRRRPWPKGCGIPTRVKRPKPRPQMLAG